MNKEKGRSRCSHYARLNIKCDTFIAGNYNPSLQLFHLVRGPIFHHKKGDMGGYGIWVLSFSSSGISVLNFDFNMRYCGII